MATRASRVSGFFPEAQARISRISMVIPARVKAAATYYPAFDWLRISLAVMVMMHHADLFPWGMLGHFRVQVFFALSGWLIGRILLKTTTAELPRFYFGRILRIWIPYAVALGLLLAASALRDQITLKYLEVVFYKLTFVYNLFGTSQLAEHVAEMPLSGAGNHFWSICAEEQFYLFAPLLLILMPYRIGRSPWLWCALAALGVFSSISLGVAASLAHARWGSLHLQPKVRLALAAAMVAGGLLIAHDAGWYNYAVPVVALSIVLLLAKPGEKGATGAFLGGMSYQLYLNHWLGLFAAHAIASRLGLDQKWMAVLVGFPVSLLFASTLYVLIDKRALANRDRWYTAKRARIAMIAAYSTTCVGLVGATLWW